MRTWAGLMVAIAIFFDAGVTRAMTFTIEHRKIDNELVAFVAASGPIEQGDAERLLAISLAERTDFLLLRSPGGSVPAALALGSVISSQRYTVLVDGLCASACASILFPSGERSLILNGGGLGFHSCYNAVTREIAEICNEGIADFNATQGFPYGSIQMFVDAIGADDLRLMTEITAKCFGYYRDFNAPAKPAFPDKPCVDALIILNTNNVASITSPVGPSFDCNAASNRIEFLFCADEELMLVDALMGELYAFFRGRLTGNSRSAFIQSQVDWIHSRNADCDRFFTADVDYAATRDAAHCLSDYNQSRMQSWIDGYFANAFR